MVETRLQPRARHSSHFAQGGAPWQRTKSSTTSPAFEPSSKRRRGFPSETRVGRGIRFVNGDKLLEEKLGRNDLCPCGSGRRFQALLSFHIASAARSAALSVLASAKCVHIAEMVFGTWPTSTCTI